MPKSQPGDFLKCVRALLAGKGLVEVPDCQLLEWFVADHEEAAFNALIRRHGPMVLDVGRRLLGNHHDAEDVFQATFIILARNAKAIRKKRAVAGWLHGVAQRLAFKARSQATRRKAREKQAASVRRSNLEPVWTELNQDLDRALQGLPAKYREALVLCYLEGKTQEQASKQLGCPLGTVQSRLAQGKKLLRDRLARRGLNLGAGAFTTVLATTAAAHAVPVELRHITLKAALDVAAGKALVPALVSAKVVALVNSGIKAMIASKVKLICATIVSVSLLGFGAGALAHHLSTSSDPSGASKSTLRQGPRGAAKAEPAHARAPGAKKQVEIAAKKELAAGTDLYGDPLPEGAVTRLGTVRFRPGVLPTATAVSTDGRFLAAGVSVDIQILDAETGKTLQRIPGKRDEGVSGLTFSTDGRLLAAFESRASRLQTYDVATGKLVKRFEVKPDKPVERKSAALNNMEDRVPFLAFLPGRNTLLLTDGGPTVRLIDVTSGEEVRAFATRSHIRPSIALAENGQKLAVMDEDGTVRLWETASGKELLAIDKHKAPPTAKGQSGSPYAKLAFAPGGKVLASANYQGSIFLWDVASGQLLQALEARDAEALGAIAALSFSPDGKSLVASHGKAMVIWDTSTKKEAHRLNYPESAVKASLRVSCSLAARYLPDGKTLLVGGVEYNPSRGAGYNETVFFFVDAATGKPCRVLDGNFADISTIVYAPDGMHVATMGQEGTSSKFRVWETSTGHFVFEAGEQPCGSLMALTFSPDGKTLIAAYVNGIAYWDVKTGQASRTFATNRSIVRAMASNGTKLVTCDYERIIRIRDLNTGKELLSFQAGKKNPKSPFFFSRENVAFSSDLELAAIGDLPSPDQDEGIQIWDLSSGKEWKRFARGGHSRFELAFSSDARTLLESSGERMMYLWEVASGQQRQATSTMERIAPSAAYSPDNRHIAFGAFDPRNEHTPFDAPIYIYNVAGHRFVSTLHGHEGKVKSLCFSPDGRYLASGSNDMTGLLWDVAKRTGPLPATSLTAKARAECWADLAGTAKDAFACIWKLAADKDSVSFLRENLAPAEAPATLDEIQKLVADLGSDQVTVRAQAAKELTKLGPRGEEGLRSSLVPGLALETHRRVEEILRVINRHHLRLIRAIEVLETIHTPAARTLLEALAQGYEGAWQTREAKASLGRLVAHRGQ